MTTQNFSSALTRAHFADPLSQDRQDGALLAAVKGAMGQQKIVAAARLAEYRASVGDVASSLAALNMVSATGPQHIDLSVRRGRLMGQMGRGRAALRLFTAMAPAVQNHPNFMLAYADSARNQQKWPLVLSLAQEGLKLNPNSANFRRLTWAAQAHLGQDVDTATMAGDDVAIEMVAAGLIDAGNVQAGLDLLDKGLVQWPNHVRLLKARAMMDWMVKQSTDFFGSFAAAIKKQPSDLGLILTGADLLTKADRFDEAAKLLQSYGQPSPFVDGALALALAELDAAANLGEIETLANRAIMASPRHDGLRRVVATALLMAESGENAYGIAQYGVSAQNDDQEWLALLATSARMIGASEYGQLYDYEKFVQFEPLTAPNGQDLNEFMAQLADVLRYMHQYTNHPLDQSLRRGSQLPLNPNQSHHPLIDDFFAALAAPIAKYRAKIGTDKAHPFSARNDGKYELSGAWSVRLGRGGSHVNHIHPEGWISSALYVALPEGMAEAAPFGPGHICFGAPRFPLSSQPAEKSVAPKIGHLALFPSYMWHGVNAFENGDERMTIAFDVVTDTN